MRNGTKICLPGNDRAGFALECVGGAGQPYALMAKKLQRAQGLYEIDRSAMFKRSERNPVIDAMYANGLADRAHELLHIEYKD